MGRNFCLSIDVVFMVCCNLCPAELAKLLSPVRLCMQSHLQNCAHAGLCDQIVCMQYHEELCAEPCLCRISPMQASAYAQCVHAELSADTCSCRTMQSQNTAHQRPPQALL